jgi:hypothetical protein
MNITDLLPNLSAAVARHLFDTVRGSLPRPILDTPENRAARDKAAIAAIVGLQPGDAFEAMRATLIVVADAHAADCLRRADQPGTDAKTAHRSRTLAGALARQVRDALRTYQSHQASRRRSEAGKQPAVAAGLSDQPHVVSLPASLETPRPVVTDLAAEASRQRAARIRALDLRVIETPATRH